ncbi:CgeB family protein [Methanococcoides seepicolus]|uniref:Glycosyltransferase n=1 Tax=Methanococcoides seepicolus TaxID=2828780 RepID=A0A9E5DCY7_9EURY|nr:glycosyltransferase [Methanococcoides seepicolus]MCM1987583.1 glycosyltransferase [Methanococcoides seepicolus]
MKILAFTSTIDLKHRLGCTPSWWQLLKALHETGNEVIVLPYLGGSVESLWWRTYDNPCKTESLLFNKFLNKQKKVVDPAKTQGLLSPITSNLIKYDVKPKVRKQLHKIIEKEKDIDLIFFMNIPLNHITGIASEIKSEFNIPCIYYDGDMPTILPKYASERGFKFDYYVGADLSEYDAFFVNSKGVIDDLKEAGAKNVQPLYYAADPDLFAPVNVEKTRDVSFFGYGSELREEWMTKMISEPSKKMDSTNFSVGGGHFGIDMGNSDLVGDISYSAFREFCCGSKINLNITRWSHTNIYASATARPFELAAYGACMVSQPYNGIDEWFDIGKELIVVNSEEEAIETYEWLLSDDEERTKIGEKARERVLKEHTYRNRAETIIEIYTKIR